VVDEQVHGQMTPESATALIDAICAEESAAGPEAAETQLIAGAAQLASGGANA
jgi:hypothetical protein